MAIVLSLGIFASVAQAGDGNGNGGKPKGGTNICQPGFHDEGGTCVHTGAAAGNCGQNQSGDTGDGNDSNRGNGGDKGDGNRDGCDTIAPPPPATPPPATPPPSTVPDSPTPQAGSTPASTPPNPQTNQTPATPHQPLAQRVAFKPPAFKHKPKAVKHKPKVRHKANAIRHKAKGIKHEAKQAPKRPAASKGATALLVTANAPRKAPFTK
jgi:hypothetical protein